ncbi:transposase domain-containing protein [bacterium]|nr:transposase domain-containing protein [bacterium]
MISIHSRVLRRNCASNHPARALRRVALGRKNWLFAGGDEGGRRAAILYTIIASCRQHGVEPFAYLRDVLARNPEHLQSRIEELLPNRWQAETPPSNAATPALVERPNL